MAIIAFVTGFAFYFCFTRPWDKHEEEMNMLKESEYKGHILGGSEKRMEDGDAEQVPPVREVRE